MASAASIEILDLRHFAAPVLRPVLEVEGELWKQRLHWDYHTSSRLLMQYLDSHMLPGYAALEAGRIAGYTFCVYEESKAVIGDVFALPNPPSGGSAAHGLRPAFSRQIPASALEIEKTLLRHLFELLMNSPHVDRIESQLLLHPSGAHAEVFREAGFQVSPRLFMVRHLNGLWDLPRVDLPGDLEMRPWRDEDLVPASRLITAAYRDHPDSVINDQYRSSQGSQRFLHNIVRYAGCGIFSAQVSFVVFQRGSQELAALVLGSRVVRRAATSPSSASIPATAAAAWPASCSPRPPTTSCTRASAKSPSPSPSPTPTPSLFIAPRALPARIASTPLSGSAKARLEEFVKTIRESEIGSLRDELDAGWVFRVFSIQVSTQIWVPHPRRVFVSAARVRDRRCPDRIHMGRKLSKSLVLTRSERSHPSC